MRSHKDIHDDGTDDDSPAATKFIGYDWKDWHRDLNIFQHRVRNGGQYHGSNRIDGVEEAEGRSVRISEVVFPVSDRLEGVHHGPIVSGCSRGRKNDQKEL